MLNLMQFLQQFNKIMFQQSFALSYRVELKLSMSYLLLNLPVQKSLWTNFKFTVAYW
jgi:hypothetical protein